jgi:hypothetical protein
MAEFERDEYGEELKNDKSIVRLNIEREKSGGKGYVIGGKGQLHFERLLKLGFKILQSCINKNLKIIISVIAKDKDTIAYFNEQTLIYDKVKENLFDTLPNNSDENQINIYNVEDNRISNLNQNKTL